MREIDTGWIGDGGTQVIEGWGGGTAEGWGGVE